MREIEGNIWNYHPDHWIIITTNGTVRNTGESVMGRGIALQAKRRFPNIPHVLGQFILRDGNVLSCYSSLSLIFFPVKHNWWEKADIDLIEKSARETEDLFNNLIVDYPVPIYLVRPGCGNGGLYWEDVKPILERYLDDRFVVVSLEM